MRAVIIAVVMVWFAEPLSAQMLRTDSSDNFRVHHTYDDEFGKRVLALAEQHHKQIGEKWFGKVPSHRNKCEIQFKVDGGSNPGLTHLQFDHNQLIIAQIELKITHPDVWTNVLPHEITHLLMAAYLGQQTPRWLDEGVAMCNEATDTSTKAWTTVRSNVGHYQLRSLSVMIDYPPNSPLFYAQSNLVVRCLVKLKGEMAFATFVKDSTKDGVEVALLKHYQLTFEELEKLWRTNEAKTNR